MKQTSIGTVSSLGCRLATAWFHHSSRRRVILEGLQGDEQVAHSAVAQVGAIVAHAAFNLAMNFVIFYRVLA